MEEKKILLLRSCKNDFEKIVNTWEKFRYLEVKKYWESRVLEKNWDYKEFDLIKLQKSFFLLTKSKDGCSVPSLEVVFWLLSFGSIIKPEIFFGYIPGYS